MALCHLQAVPENEGEEVTTTIKVERCEECHFWVNGNYTDFLCALKETTRKHATDRKFPRWCPLLKSKVIVEKA